MQQFLHFNLETAQQKDISKQTKKVELYFKASYECSQAFPKGSNNICLPFTGKSSDVGN
jgi:hypothetical protein